MTRLLYLDFDGVLHPTSATPARRFCRSGLLAEALAGHRCEIVISTSWRHHHSIDELLRCLPTELGQRVIGTTGEPFIGRWPRYNEILGHRDACFPGYPWRALDDAWIEFPPRCPELIACDPNKGLDVAQASVLTQWLLRA